MNKNPIIAAFVVPIGYSSARLPYKNRYCIKDRIKVDRIDIELIDKAEEYEDKEEKRITPAAAFPLLFRHYCLLRRIGNI